jgi:hypothetical protein
VGGVNESLEWAAFMGAARLKRLTETKMMTSIVKTQHITMRLYQHITKVHHSSLGHSAIAQHGVGRRQSRSPFHPKYDLF